MLLSQIVAKPEQFQKRGKPYSETTVESIVREGIDLAKFDPIPLLPLGDGVYCIGGDGHSRFEAIQRLAKLARLPDAWCIPAADEWNIPHRFITAAEAKKLSRTANLSRDQFTAPEEAAVYQEMVDEGMTIEAIAAEAHKSPETIKRTLILNSLADCIKERVGKSTNAGGVTKDAAIELAESFTRYGVAPQSQQQLWNTLLSKVDLTPAGIRGMRALFSRVGQAAKETQTQGLMFAMPPNVDAVIAETKARAAKLTRAERAIATLVGLADDDVLAGLVELKSLIKVRGENWIQQLRYEQDTDGASVGNLLQVA